MAAYQCLNCHRIERNDEVCCANPDLFRINDMPAEILRLRATLKDIATMYPVTEEGETMAQRARAALKA